MLKRTLSLFLSLVIVFSMFSVTAVTANAEETSTVSTKTTTEDVNISGTNSLGNMLADEYSENVDEEEFIGNNIYEIEVENSTVHVDLQALTDAKLIVALYDESTQEMLCTGMKDVGTDDTVVQVELDVDTMPQYFVIKAYMLDAETNVPLCKQFECDTYTQEMQEFLAKTTEDFDQEKVLTLDEQNDNNFLVYNDETVRTEGNEYTNVVTVTDETAQKYVIENIDESISSLQAGDIFSHTYGDEENILIIKVSSITINGTTATIYGEEVELEEAFDFIKIDASQGTSETTVDNTELEDGVEYLGVEDETNDKEPPAVGATLVDKEITAGTSLKYELDKKFGPCKISGDIGCKFEAKLKCYYDAKLFKKDDVEFSFAIKYEASIGVGIELATDDDSEIKVKLGALGFSPIPGVYINFTPSIVVEGKVSVELNGTLSGQVGKKFKNGEFSDNSKKAEFNSEFKVSGELFIGFSMEPKIGVVGDIITASAEAKTGIKISAEMKYSNTIEVDVDEKHLCNSCIDGDITWHTELSFELKLLDSKNLTWKATAFKLDKKLCNFYYSFDFNKFAFSSCPYSTYKQTITIVNMDNGFQVVEGADVNGVKTDENGIAVLYFTKGTHNVVIKKDSIVLNKSIDVKKSDKHSFILDPSSSTVVSESTKSDEVEDENRYSPAEGTETNRYYFYMPSNWFNDYAYTAGIYWWDGTDACPTWPGYNAQPGDVANVYYVDVPTDVSTIIWNNGLDGGEDSKSEKYAMAIQTTDIYSEFYSEGDTDLYDTLDDGNFFANAEKSLLGDKKMLGDFAGNFFIDKKCGYGISFTMNNMIYVIDPSKTFKTLRGNLAYCGEWYFYYGNGTYGPYPTRDKAVATGTLYNTEYQQPKQSSVTTDPTAATINYNMTAKATSSVANNLIKEDTSITLPNDLTQAIVNPPVVSTDNTETTTVNEYTRTNLVPNTEAVLMIAQGTAEDYEINTSTLLYITQTTVDENGTATFNSYGDFSDTYWVALIFGECTHSSSKWETVKEATYTETGLEVCICDYCGEIIESKDIEVKAPEYPFGDVNNDNVVSILDATQIQKYLVGITTLTEAQEQNADVNNDGVVSIIDATEIQKYLAGISSRLNNL